MESTVEAVVDASYSDWNSRNWDGKVVVGQAEIPDLHVLADNEGYGRCRRLSVAVRNGQPQGIGAVQKHGRIERAEDRIVLGTLGLAKPGESSFWVDAPSWVLRL